MKIDRLKATRETFRANTGDGVPSGRDVSTKQPRDQVDPAAGQGSGGDIKT